MNELVKLCWLFRIYFVCASVVACSVLSQGQNLTEKVSRSQMNAMVCFSSVVFFFGSADLITQLARNPSEGDHGRPCWHSRRGMHC